MEGIKYYFTTEADADEVAGFYNDADHATIPDGAVETTKEEIDTACEAQANGGKRICVTSGKIDLQTAPSRLHFWKGGKWVLALDDAKSAKLREITAAFDDSFLNGSFLSTTLGIEVDCRRSGTKNDEQNVRGIISRMTRAGVNQIVYKGKTEEVPATLEQIQQLQYEMEDYASFVYTKKWEAEAKVEAATTAEDLQTITW